MKEIDALRLRELVHFDPNTGVFTRLKATKGAHTGVGERADYSNQHGYRRLCVDGTEYMAHRAAWAYIYGAAPKGHIDHINGDSSDNRLFNLRDVSREENMQNQRKANSTSRHGFLGATPYMKRWKASILTGGKRTHLGVFDTPEEAHAAYLEAKRRIHAGCTI